LGMRDTSFILTAEKFDRAVTAWTRENGGPLKCNDRKLPNPPKTYNGGGGLYSTAADYVRFMQMIMHQGRGPGGTVILRPKTVASMQVNQIGGLTAGKMRSFAPDTSSDVDM